ncbi:MAG: hypothetical protein KatS3mg057_1878 [Herpetosiphonaceae bacterium]|nr:MAG: hypothetical protein KatS3mg057_1878 [Herpetosiphonaceae bacterium]
MARVEPIDLREKRFNYLPARFMWRGEQHRIRRVERVWSRPGRGARSPRTYFRVRCYNDKVFDIFQDVRLNAWYLER